MNLNLYKYTANRTLVFIRKILCLGNQRRAIAVIGYAAILGLLLKIVWGMWEWRDLTYGDTSFYNLNAHEWLQGGRFKRSSDLSFSPLYTVFYSWFIGAFTSDYAATICHRLAILFILGPAILLLCRLALPRGVAWFIAAWWVVLPINWNSLYEVHLFALIMFVAGSCFAGLRDSTFARASGVACFFAGSLLVRNEFLLATGLLGAASAAWEFRSWKKSGNSVTSLARQLFKLAAPSLVVLLVSAFIFRSSFHSWKQVLADFNDRQRLNISQVYAFSYQQRHPEWTKNPWADGNELLKQDFGTTEVTFGTLVRTNPRAFWEHVGWNLRLLPSGLQLGMFNCFSGRDTPDFIEFKGGSKFAKVASAIFCVVIGAGIVCFLRRKVLWLRFLRGRRAWCWFAMATTLVPSMVAIVTQRPRPSYIFMMSLFLMMLAGLCFSAVLKQLRVNRFFNSLSPLLAVPVILFAQSKKDTAQIYSGRPYFQIYQRLYPFRSVFANERTVYGAERSPSDILMYLGRRFGPDLAHALSPSSQDGTGAAFGQFLSDAKITLLYLDFDSLERLAVKEWLASGDADQWSVLAKHDYPSEKWLLVQKR